MQLNKNSKIFIAGHNGMVGSAILNHFKNKKYKKLITVKKNKLDLLDQKKTEKYLKSIKPEFVIIAAARVGGILANEKNKADFIYQNIMIQTNLINSSYKAGVKKLIFLGSSCIYPKFSKQPIREDSLLSGKLEKTNDAYAIAKIAGIKLCEALYEDYKLDIMCLMPTNVYGDNDNFNKISGHVIPAIISKIEEAKKSNKKTVKLLGTGKPLREFIHAEDLADSIIKCLDIKQTILKKKFKSKLPIINVGTNEEVSIKALSKLIAKFVEFNGRIKFDKKSPDGTYRKGLNSNKIRQFGWRPRIKLIDGLKKVIKKRM